jgi:hypothetical protein
MSDAGGIKQAGAFTLDSFKVSKLDGSKSVDIRLIIHAFNIVESMSAGSIRGTAMVYDSADLVTTFPLLGEELVEITYTDYYGTKRTDVMFLYGVADVGYATDTSGSMTKYTLSFASLPKVLSENVRVQKTYKPNTVDNLSKISDYVKSVYDEHYKKPVEELSKTPKNIVIESTDGAQGYVIPRLTPEQTMHFFARKAYSAASDTQSFRFFESREMFFFTTNEYMLERLNPNAGRPVDGPGGGVATPSDQTIVPIFTRNYSPDRNANRQLTAMSELLSVDFKSKVNTVEDINKGAYKKATYEIDVLNGTITKTDYDHLQTFKEEKQKLVHGSKFIDERISKEKERFVIKDYASIGATQGTDVRDEMYYASVYNVKPTTFYHYERNKIGVTIYGRNKIFAGSVIEIKLAEATSKTDSVKIDVERSGKYIVESVDNQFNENIYTQKLMLSRGGIGA